MQVFVTAVKMLLIAGIIVVGFSPARAISRISGSRIPERRRHRRIFRRYGQRALGLRRLEQRQHGFFGNSRAAAQSARASLILGTLAVIATYLLINVAYFYVLGPSDVGSSGHVAADMMSRLHSPAATTRMDPTRASGSSRTLPRYAAAIRRDRKEALEQLDRLRDVASAPARQANIGRRGPDALARRADRARGGGKGRRRPRTTRANPSRRLRRNPRRSPGRKPSLPRRRRPPRRRTRLRTASRPNPGRPRTGRSARSTASSAGGSRPWPGGRREPRPQAARAGAASPPKRGSGRRAGASAGAGVRSRP